MKKSGEHADFIENHSSLLGLSVFDLYHDEMGTCKMNSALAERFDFRDMYSNTVCAYWDHQGTEPHHA